MATVTDKRRRLFLLAALNVGVGTAFWRLLARRRKARRPIVWIGHI